MANIVYGIYMLLYYYYWFLIIFVILSWIPQIRYSTLYLKISILANSYLGIFRRFIPPIGGLDFSPILALLVLNFARNGFGALYVSLLQ